MGKPEAGPEGMVRAKWHVGTTADRMAVAYRLSFEAAALPGVLIGLDHETGELIVSGRLTAASLRRLANALERTDG